MLSILCAALATYSCCVHDFPYVIAPLFLASPLFLVSPIVLTQYKHHQQGSGADKAGSIWRPVATEGYTSIGDFVALGRGKPATNLMYTVANGMVCVCM